MNAPTCRHLARKAFDGLRAFLEAAPAGTAIGDPKGFSFIHGMLLHAASVPAYVLPASGRLLGDSVGSRVLAALAGANPGSHRIPSPITVIEFASDATAGAVGDKGGIVPDARVVIACDPSQVSNGFSIPLRADGASPAEPLDVLFYSSECYRINGEWQVDPFIWIVFESPVEHEGQMAMRFVAATWTLAPIIDPLLNMAAKDEQRVGMLGVSAIFELICALACKNVHRETMDAPRKLNAANKKRGKPPLPGYHYLTLDSEEPSRGSGSGASHASPRLHIRRGHVRIVKGERPVWVRQHMVGKPGSGFISKDYNATRLTA